MVQMAVSAGAIGQDEEELYLYAYQSLLASVISWASLLLIAAVLQAFWGAVLFMLFFIPLRSYAGGYHQSSYLRCYLLSVASFAGLGLTCPFLARVLPLWVVGALLLLAAAAIFWRAPVADPNKPLDDTQRVKYRARARITLLLELAALAAFYCLKLPRELLLFAAAGPLLAAWLVVCPPRRAGAQREPA